MPVEKHPFKRQIRDIPSDGTLVAADGWHEMDVKWLITRDAVGSTCAVVGRSVFPPGARHDLHRHPNAEEWEYVLQGQAVKRVGDDEISLTVGDLVFVPKDVLHSLANASAEDVLITIWGYCGAGSLAEAGYIIPTDEVARGQ